MNPKTKPNFLRQTLAAGLILLAAGAASADSGSGSVTAATDTRDYTLTVASAQGTPSPAVGTHAYAWQASVTASNAAVSGSFLNTGWVGSGSVPATGATNNTGAIVLTEVTSSITWQWAWIPAPPGITSPPTATGQVGVGFAYSITASNFPSWFGASGLPPGLICNTNTGVIAGLPTASGTFNAGILAGNIAGANTQTLAVIIAPSVPSITSPLSASGQQGQTFSYTITASNSPSAFTATGLPNGLAVGNTTGVISGTPQVSGTFNVTIGTVNPWGTDSQTLILTIASSVPGITSGASAAGQQGQPFSYTITASNSPTWYGAVNLPNALAVNATNGGITGIPTVFGTYTSTITAGNPWGSASQTLTLSLTSSVPVITSPLSASGMENSNLSYQITATGSPTNFGASGLPLGLSVDAGSGLIAGAPVSAGTFNALIWAQNAWGAASNTLTLNVSYAPLTGLSIQDVQHTYSSPYLLDFVFSLRDGVYPQPSLPVVLPLTNFEVTIYEGGAPMDPYESSHVFDYAKNKQMRAMVVLDYSASMVKTNVNQPAPFTIKSPQVLAMEAAAESFVNQLPTNSLIGVYEMHGFPNPALVQNFTMNQTLVNQKIAGIFTNATYNIANTAYLSPVWDAAVAAINQFSPNPMDMLDEDRFVLLISDGNNNYSTNTITTVINAATSANVKVYCVGYGNNIITNNLDTLASGTQGRAYYTTNLATLGAQFALVGEDIDGQYLLRWATPPYLPFQPAFTLACQGFVASFNTGTADPSLLYDCSDPEVEGDPSAGVLRFVAYASDSASSVNLRCAYAPLYINHLRLHYRANYPACSVTLQSVLPGEIMSDWTMTTTNDGMGGTWLDLINPLAPLPMAALGDLLTFNMPGMTDVQTAFSFFTVDNSLYAGDQTFAVQNASSFITYYPIILHGSAPTSGHPFQMSIPTDVGRTYRVETATSLGSWSTLQDGIDGTGGLVTVTDTRNLSGVTSVFYRVAAY